MRKNAFQFTIIITSYCILTHHRAHKVELAITKSIRHFHKHHRQNGCTGVHIQYATQFQSLIVCVHPNHAHQSQIAFIHIYFKSGRTFLLLPCSLHDESCHFLTHFNFTLGVFQRRRRQYTNALSREHMLLAMCKLYSFSDAPIV